MGKRLKNLNKKLEATMILGVDTQRKKQNKSKSYIKFRRS